MPALHPDIADLGFLVGTWRGRGTGNYPTIEPFAYDEEITIAHSGRPFLRYEQRTTRAGTGEPLHAETGYWRAGPEGAELVITQPTGITEVLIGAIEATSITLESLTIGRTPTAKDVHTTERIIRVDGDTMTYEFHMAAVDQAHQLHLEATLTRETP